MTQLLTTIAAAATAIALLAADGRALAAESADEASSEDGRRAGVIDLEHRRTRAERRGGPLLPPLRLDLRTPFRQGLGPGAVLALGSQVSRTRSLALDLTVAYQSGRLLTTPGPQRSQLCAELGVDARLDLGRWLGVGPTAGIDYRWFRQQGMTISDAWIPVVGAKLDSTLLRTRHWSVVIGARATVDTVLTRFVLETAQVRMLQPVEGQVGLKINFGNGDFRGGQP